MSALFKPIAAELGFSRAAISIAASIGRFHGGFEALVTGWLTDRFGPRWIIISGVFLIGLGLILMNFVTSLWAYYIVWGVITGTGINIALSLPMDKAISNWFVKKRGLALSIRWTFTGLATICVLPLIALLISTHGWRIACLTGGVVMWIVGLPLSWFFIRRERPEYYGLLPDGALVEKEALDTGQMLKRGVEYAAEVDEIEFSLRQAMRTPAYWLLIIANSSYGMVVSVVILHCIPFLTDMGIKPVKAAVMMGTMSAVSIPARLVAGILADRVKISQLRFLIGGAFCLQAVGLAIFLLNQTIGMAYLFILLYYFGMGTSLPLFGVIRARYFGRKSVGSIGGTSSVMMTPFSVIAPIYAGWTYDTTGSYINAFTIFAVLLAFAGIIMSMIRPPIPPAEVGDIRKVV
jgi:sugar phosphate permease